MKRRTSFLSISMAGFLWASSGWTMGQEIQSPLDPSTPFQVLGPQLIAWSQVQEPQPVSQTSPPPDRPVPQEDQQPMQSSAPADQQQSAGQTFVGKIVKEDGKYVLKVSSNNAYQIFDQDRARQYEGKQVRIAGKLDANGNTLHIVDIEPMS